MDTDKWFLPDLERLHLSYEHGRCAAEEVELRLVPKAWIDERLASKPILERYIELRIVADEGSDDYAA